MRMLKKKYFKYSNALLAPYSFSKFESQGNDETSPSRSLRMSLYVSVAESWIHRSQKETPSCVQDRWPRVDLN